MIKKWNTSATKQNTAYTPVHMISVGEFDENDEDNCEEVEQELSHNELQFNILKIK